MLLKPFKTIDKKRKKLVKINGRILIFKKIKRILYIKFKVLVNLKILIIFPFSKL